MSHGMRMRRRPSPSVRVRVEEYAEGGHRSREDRLATEEPLEIRLAWPGHRAERVGVTMRTPGHDFELATGSLFAEGMLQPEALTSVAYCTDARLSPEQEFNVVTVTLAAAPGRLPTGRAATVLASASACGVCGTDSIDEVLGLAGVRAGGLPATTVGAATLRALPRSLRDHQRVFDSTGGLHAAGLFTETGELLVLREDVGRHNAVDKVVGARLLAGASPGAPLLCVSGRIGFEIVQKAVAAGVAVLAAIGAPSSLAVGLAEQAGLGLVGFLSERRFVVYAGGERIGV